MTEPVRSVSRPWLVGIAVVAIAALYFMLLGTSNYPEPGPNLEYDLQSFEDLDNIETPYVEAASLKPGIEDPRALAIAGDRVYVAGKNAVVEFDGSGRELARLTIDGTPNCMAVGPEGAIYLGMHRSVRVVDAKGAVRQEWTKDFADRSYLTSIAVSGPDVYVADAGQRVVFRFDQAGNVQARIGRKDPARDVPGLEVPSPYLDLAINRDGDLWVVNPGKLGLEQYRSDGSFVTSWYRPSLKLDGFPGCCNPTHIAFDSKGELVTCEKGLVRVKRFEVTAGTFEGLVVGSEVFPQEHSLRDLAVDSHDRILALDSQRNEVRVFTLKENHHGLASQPA